MNKKEKPAAEGPRAGENVDGCPQNMPSPAICQDNIPQEIIARSQWVNWQAEPKDNGKINKIPICSRTGAGASHSNEKTWSSSQDALSRYNKGKVSGIGFVFTENDPYCGIDLDKCRNPKTGFIELWAQKEKENFQSYTEISPSGTGLHIIVKGQLPEGGRKKGQIEIYDQLRFFTVTGNRLESTPHDIRPAQNAIDALLLKYFKKEKAAQALRPFSLPQVTESDAELIQKAINAGNGHKFNLLFKGQWQEAGYPSQSEADQAFCNQLAFWFAKDAGRMDVIFRGSRLMRPKWDRKHFGDGRTYGQATIETAISNCHEIYTGTWTPQQVGQPPNPPDVAQKTAEHLASLSPFEYEQQRVAMAKKLNVRIGTLDAEVEKLQKTNSPDKAKSLVEELEPWPEPVVGGELLDTIYKVVLDYVIMPAGSAVAFSLWTLLTYSYNAFRILPVLELKSPEKRCGKTRLLEVLSALAHRAFPSCNLTSATVYRVIEKCQPCFLIDEADTFLPNNDELRGVLNSGHTVKNAFVIRCNSETNEPERFSTWCPKAIALIGKLPSTLDDRAIVISLKRKLPTETVKRLGLDFDDECLDLRRKCKRWAIDNLDRLKAAVPQLPPIDNDRALDNWGPLVAIADLASDGWGKSAREFMKENEAGKEDDSARVMLIQDIQSVFNDRKCESLWTQNLIEALVAMEDRPWAEWKIDHGRNGR
ncbi:MAG: hypothetical protein DRP37_02350, partial [Thermodesulfobacteriota bacterium]